MLPDTYMSLCTTIQVWQLMDVWVPSFKVHTHIIDKYIIIHILTDDIVLWTKRIHHSLVPVTSEPLDDDLHKNNNITPSCL